MGKNQLIVQLPMAAAADFDTLVGIEDTLIQAFEQNRYAVVDGHDAGQGRFNIFLFPTGAWGPVIDRVKAFLKLRGVLAQAVIAKRLKSHRYVVFGPRTTSVASSSNKRIEFVPLGRPTRNREAPLLAAHSRRSAERK